MKLLEPGFELTLRPMRYVQFYEAYKTSIANSWRVEEVDFREDVVQLKTKMKPGQRHMISRLVAFFATGDSLVANNVAISLYRHVNSPEARMYFSRQLAEEALHIQFYLTLLDSYVPEHEERHAMFAAVKNVPSIATKAQFCNRWMMNMFGIRTLETREDRREFIYNTLTFANAVEGLFFYGAFAYVFFLRSRGMLPGLAHGTNWVFRDESMHMMQAMEVVRIAREEEPDLLTTSEMEIFRRMIKDAVDAESVFAEDLLSEGVAGLSARDMRTYLEHVADARLAMMGLAPEYKSKNPFDFLANQDLGEMTNFFERRVSAYGVATEGKFSMDEEF